MLLAPCAASCGEDAFLLGEIVGDSGDSGDAGPLPGATAFPRRYEAEAVPPNVLQQSATVDDTCFGTNLSCPQGGVVEGANCCSGGGVVNSLLGRVPCSGPPGSPGDNQNCQLLGGGVDFSGVFVPAAGTYDVTWWYHCGESNSFGDTACGGLHYDAGTSCRPHLIDVNGVAVSAATTDGAVASVFQFPCYAGLWSVVHAATTALTLSAGNNDILIHAPHALDLDSADIDAIDILPRGAGAGPEITPVVSGY